MIEKTETVHGELQPFMLDRSLRRELEVFFGGIASDVPALVTNRWCAAAAYCESGSIVVSRWLMERGRDVLRATLAHEFAHAVQQRKVGVGRGEFLSVVKGRALEMEADRAAACFLRGEGLPPLTAIPATAYGRRSIRRVKIMVGWGRIL